MSVADELAKLAALRDSGVLTQEEFDQQKAALLDTYAHLTPATMQRSADRMDGILRRREATSG